MFSNKPDIKLNTLNTVFQYFLVFYLVVMFESVSKQLGAHNTPPMVFHVFSLRAVSSVHLSNDLVDLEAGRLKTVSSMDGEDCWSRADVLDV